MTVSDGRAGGFGVVINSAVAEREREREREGGRDAFHSKRGRPRICNEAQH